jgi:hypothetical protein
MEGDSSQIKIIEVHKNTYLIVYTYNNTNEETLENNINEILFYLKKIISIYLGSLKKL